MRRLVLATFCVIALLTKTDPQSPHEYSRLGTVESIVDRGTYAIDDSTFIITIDKIYRDGHFYSHQPPLLSTLETPVYWGLHLPGTRFNNRGRYVMTYAFSLFTNGVALTLTVIVLAQLLGLAGVASPRRDWLAVLLPCGTWLLPYGLVTNNHGISGLLVTLLAYLLLKIEWRGITELRALAIGSVLGLLVGIEILPIVSFAPLTIAYLAMRRDLDARTWLYGAAGLAMPLLLHAIINRQITGDLIPAGFHHELFNYAGTAFDDSSLTGGLKYQSPREAAAYAWTSLIAGRGFFTFAPVLAVGLIAGIVDWRWWTRARGPYVVMFGGLALSLAASLLTTNNYGGEAVGFRHAVYLSPAFLVLLLPWLVDDDLGRHRRTNAVMAIAALSCVLMLAFGARNPWKSLTLNSAPIGTWSEYTPIVSRSFDRTITHP